MADDYRVEAGGVLVFAGGMDFEVHLDTHDGFFALVDADSQRKWSGLTIEEVQAIHEALTIALVEAEADHD